MEKVGQEDCGDLKSLEQKYIDSRFAKCKKKHFRKGLIIFVLTAASVFACLFCYAKCVVAPVVWEYGESGVEKMLVTSGNLAIAKLGSVQYDDLTSIAYDSNGKISSIITNSSKVNQLANFLATNTQNGLNEMASLGLSIPIGTCSGISFLAGRGGDVVLSVQPHGNVICKFYSTFTTSGINQTLHKLWVNIESEANLVLPSGAKTITKQVEYLVAECVIVGEVPNVYFNGKVYAD